MQLNRIGPKLFWMLALLVIPLWFISFPETTLRHNIKPIPVYLSQLTSLVGFSCFALSFVLAARIKSLENAFGGLDRMYHTHHIMAITAVILLILHPILLAVRWIPEDSGRILWYLLPVHRRFEINLGSYALWGVILLTIATFLKKLPYHHWKITHKFMGVFFVLGALHIFYLDLSFSSNPPLMAYLVLLSVTGTGAWVYKTVLFGFMTSKKSYQVTGLHRPTRNILEIELTPNQNPIAFKSGQYFFFSFRTSGLSREYHPFTVTQYTQRGDIKIMVKALGDYTKALHRNLQTGDMAYLEGPYGCFDYQKGTRSQVWIAGGVGVAPFLCWVNELLSAPRDDLKVDFYYCVNSVDDIVYSNIYKKLASQMPSFLVHYIRADREGFINVEKIPKLDEREIFICGPRAMRRHILKALKDRNFPKNRIHFEDFDFV